MSRTQVLTGYPTKLVAAAATPEQLTAVQTFVKSVIVEALPTNTDFIYIGDASFQNTAIAPGKALTITGDDMDNGTTAKIDISLIYIKVNVNGEGVSYTTLVGL